MTATVVRELKQHPILRAIPVILVTAKSDTIDVLLDGSDLDCDSYILASKYLEAKARDHGNTILLFPGDDLELFGRAIAALR